MKSNCLTNSWLTRNENKLLGALSRCLLNTDRQGASTTSLGSLSLCLSTLTVKKFFLCLVWTSPLCCSCVSCHRLLMRPETSTSFSTSPPWEVAEIIGVTSQPSLVQTSPPKCPHISSQDMPSSAFTSFAALLWMLARTSTSFLCCGGHAEDITSTEFYYFGGTADEGWAISGNLPLFQKKRLDKLAHTDPCCRCLAYTSFCKGRGWMSYHTWCMGVLPCMSNWEQPWGFLSTFLFITEPQIPHWDHLVVFPACHCKGLRHWQHLNLSCVLPRANKPFCFHKPANC